MPLKALRLKRTNIFYPTSGDTPNLGMLLSSITLNEDVVDDILDIEDETLLRNKRGAWKRDLEELISAARKESPLSPARLRRVYFHILRQGGVPENCGKNDLEHVALAYQDLMAELHRGFPAVWFPQLPGLLIFGHWGGFDLDKAQPLTYEAYKGRLAVLTQCGRYSHIPGMLAKIDNFIPFAANQTTSRRILVLLRLVKYLHSDFMPAAPKAYSPVDLVFWGLVTIVLLNEACRDELFRDLVGIKSRLPKFDEHVEILARYVAATADKDIHDGFTKFKATLAGSATKPE